MKIERIRESLVGTVLLGTISLLSGCESTGPVSGQSSAPNGDEVLTLNLVSAERIAGNYRRGSVSLQFDASAKNQNTELAVLRADGSELFRLTRGASGVTMSALGRCTQFSSAAIMNQLQVGGVPSSEVASAVKTTGDPSAIEELESSAEFAALPWLSRSLGADGITGSSYPSALGLHLFAKRAAAVSKTAFPEVSGASHASPTAETGLVKLEGFAPGNVISCTTTGNQICCKAFNSAGITDLGCHTATPVTTTGCAYPYPDLRCDPNHDQCFGMCGNECDCWDWVCGDCTYHWQCAQHDWICRQGDSLPWYNPAKYAFISLCFSWDAQLAELSCFPQGYTSGFGSALTSATPPWQVAWYRDQSTQFDNQSDWAYGYGKADCAAGWRLNGLASWQNVDEAALCLAGDTNLYSAVVAATLVYAGYDLRRTLRTVAGSIDWDYGYIKHECGLGEYVSAIAEGSAAVIGNYNFYAVQCSAGAAVTATACDTRTIGTQDDRAPGTSAEDDWDYGALKAECGWDQYVAGVSVNGSGQVHSLLCCNTH